MALPLEGLSQSTAGRAAALRRVLPAPEVLLCAGAGESIPHRPQPTRASSALTKGMEMATGPATGLHLLGTKA